MSLLENSAVTTLSTWTSRKPFTKVNSGSVPGGCVSGVYNGSVALCVRSVLWTLDVARFRHSVSRFLRWSCDVVSRYLQHACVSSVQQCCMFQCPTNHQPFKDFVHWTQGNFRWLFKVSIKTGKIHFHFRVRFCIWSKAMCTLRKPKATSYPIGRNIWMLHLQTET